MPDFDVVTRPESSPPRLGDRKDPCEDTQLYPFIT